MDNQMIQSRNQQTDTIDLLELAGVLWNGIAMILATGAVFALAALLVTKFMMSPQYTSTTKMYVMSKQDTTQITTGDMQASALLSEDYTEIIQSRTVTEAVIAALNLDMTVNGLRGMTSINMSNGKRVITITVTDSDPYRAQKIADEVRKQGAKHIENVMNSAEVTLVDPANIPAAKSGPSAMKNAVLGGMLGCILVCAVLIIRHLLDDGINNSDDVERYLGLSVLGTIPVEADERRGRRSRKRGRA